MAVTDWALTTGATPSTCGASSLVAIASASSIVISAARVDVAFWLVVVSPPRSPGGPPPPGPPKPPVKPPPPPFAPAVTVRVLLPSELIDSWTARLEPVPTATRMMTAATPMRMPRVVRAERGLVGRDALPRETARLTDVHATDAPVGRHRGGASWTSARRSSETMRPSLIRITRLACAATSSSWVMTTTVRPPTASSSKSAEDVGGAVAVQGAGGLVREEQDGFGDDRASHRHPLLLATRQLGRHVVCPVRQADPGQGRCSPLGPFVSTHPAVGQRELDVALRGGAGDQVEALEDEPDLAVADEREPALVETPDVDPVQQVAAPGADVEATDDVHQRGLAGS